MSFRLSVRYSIRMMSKQPLFAAAIVLTLGICIGAVTAVFSIIDATLLRPLPYPEPDRLAQLVIRSSSGGAAGLQSSQDGATWEHFSGSSKTMDFAVYSDGVSRLNFSSGGRVGYIAQQRVGAGFFHVFGVPPTIGREFTPAEDVPNGPAVAVLSHRLWQRDFRADPSVVGQSVTIAGVAYQIVGIASKDFESRADLWTPLRPSRRGEGQGINYTIVGRVRSGVSWAQADAEMASLGQPILQQRRFRPGVNVRYSLMSIQEAASEAFSSSLWTVFAAAILVLVIGCVNIAGMLMARGAARAPEIATRMAIGANRGAIIRQLLSESFATALAGGIVGVVIGDFSLKLMKSILPPSFSALQTARLDLRVLLAIASVSMLTSVMFGLFPAWRAGRVDIRSVQSSRAIAGHSSRSFARRALSIVQIAIAVAILIGAGLLIRSFRYLTHLDSGIDARNVITANFALLDARYSNNAAASRYFANVLERLHQIPGIEAAAISQAVPFERPMNTVFTRPGDPVGESAKLLNLSYVSPEFFKVFRIPVVSGRVLQGSDTADSLPVIVINQAFAKRYFSNEDPIGAQLIFGAGEARQIVGVVGDVLQQGWNGSFGPAARVPAAYTSVAQARTFGLRSASPSWSVRTSGSPEALKKQIEAAVAAVDPLLPIASFRSMEEIQLRALALQRFNATLLGIAAALALLLAAIGTYAMISNAVVERTREFGIRIALGATVAQVIRTSVVPGLTCAAVGLITGLALARVGTRFVQGMLYGITPVDAATYLAVGAVVLAIVTLASLVPSLRITKLDPTQALRQE